MASRHRRVQKSCEAALGSSLEAVARNAKKRSKNSFEIFGASSEKTKKIRVFANKSYKKDAKTEALASFL
jgi:hypothetical protein